MDIKELLDKEKEKASLPQGSIFVLPVQGEKKIKEKTGFSLHEVQIKALQKGIFPGRYLRNYGTVGIKGQQKLLEACVGIVGAGGLGGWNIELLARMGIGRIIAVDNDSFEDNNLNRQLLSTEENLGKNKIDEARQRVEKINSGVMFSGEKIVFSRENGAEIFKECDVLVDALDNIPSRFELQAVAGKLQLPLVHGAISGYSGQVMTIFPGDEGFGLIYPNKESKDIEGQKQGNPAATPAMVAAWQAQEVVKIILNQGKSIRNRLLFLDAYLASVETIKLK